MDLLISTCLFFFKFFPLIAGSYIIMLLLRTVDLTVEVSWTLSSIVSCLLVPIVSPLYAILFGLLVGSFSGFVTWLCFVVTGNKKLLGGLISYSIQVSIGYHLLGDRSNIFTKADSVNFGFSTNESIFFYGLISVIIFILIARVERSKLGIKFRLIGENPFASTFYNISIRKVFLAGFIIGNAIVGFGGALWGTYYGYASNTQGIGLLVVSFTSLLIGDELVKLFRISRRTNLIVPILGTIIYVVLSQAMEISIGYIQLQGINMKSTDKNIVYSILLMILIAFKRSKETRTEIVSQW